MESLLVQTLDSPLQLDGFATLRGLCGFAVNLYCEFIICVHLRFSFLFFRFVVKWKAGGMNSTLQLDGFAALRGLCGFAVNLDLVHCLLGGSWLVLGSGSAGALGLSAESELLVVVALRGWPKEVSLEKRRPSGPTVARVVPSMSLR